jgi:hypothetical protein
MKPLRALLPLLFVGITLFLPIAAEAATANFFGPIISKECECPGKAPDWGCVLQTAQNVINLGVSLAMIFFVLIFAYAGILLMASATNPGNKKIARNMLGAAVVGLMVALSAWLLVDFVMKALYNEGSFGPWNAILSDGSVQHCLVPRDPTVAEVVGGPTAGTSEEPQTGSGENCPAADPAGMRVFPSAAVSGESESAAPTTVANFLAMREAALRDGIDLKVTDGYRSDAEQVVLWERYNHDTSQVAKPCSLEGRGSNHNSGTALDINVGCSKTNSACNTPAYNWLKEHGAQWGFRNALSNDVVHWSPSGH